MQKSSDGTFILIKPQDYSVQILKIDVNLKVLSEETVPNQENIISGNDIIEILGGHIICGSQKASN